MGILLGEVDPMSLKKTTYSSELYHYGVKGMRWGIRRYQNIDGSYTESGKRRHDRYARRAEKHDAKAAKAKTEFWRRYHTSQAEFQRGKITKDAFYNIVRAANRLDRINKKSKRILDAKEKAKTEKEANRAIKQGKKLTKKIIDNAAIMEFSVNTLSRQMDEHTKAKVDKWMVEASKNLATRTYADGQYYIQWVDQKQFAKHLETASTASKIANSRRKRPE